MKRVALVLVLVAGAVALAGPDPKAPAPAGHAPAAAAPAATSATPATSATAPARPAGSTFTHAAHANRLDITKCELCHSVSATGVVAAPAALGHAPCMSAACHATWFLATGAEGKRRDPKLYAKAATFCAGCHDSKDGAPPPAWTKPAPSAVLRSFQLEREYHVEMSHFEHTKRAQCRDCHQVDDKTLALKKDAPGHAQCVTCHNATKSPDFTMAKCGYCHDKPGRGEYFPTDSRKKTDVRACDTEGHAAHVAAKKKSVACFLHERPEHRTRADGKPVQCSDCHAMVGKQEWHQHSYKSLHDLHVSPIIDNDKDLEHRSCGRAGGCHAKDVDDSRGTGRCQLCHADKNTSTF